MNKYIINATTVGAMALTIAGTAMTSNKSPLEDAVENERQKKKSRVTQKLDLRFAHLTFRELDLLTSNKDISKERFLAF